MFNVKESRQQNALIEPMSADKQSQGSYLQHVGSHTPLRAIEDTQ